MWDLSLNSQLKTSDTETISYSETNSNVEPVQNPDDLYNSLRNFLVFGRLIGVVPLQGIFQPFSENLRFKWLSQSAIYSVIICFFLISSSIINAIVNFKTTNNSPVELAWSANLAIYYGIGSFMYIFMLKQAPKFLRLFKKWQESFDMSYIKIDQNLFRDVNTLAICMYTSCILEHSFAHLKFFPIVENSELRLLNVKDLNARLQNASGWETYYWRSHPFVGDLIPYHFISAFTIFICSKYCILAWNFGDIFVTVMSRALSYRFKMLYEQASEELFSDNGLVTKNSKKWSRFIAKHDMLCELTQEFDDLLSPLIFTLLGVNLFSFCLQVHTNITMFYEATPIWYLTLSVGLTGEFESYIQFAWENLTECIPYSNLMLNLGLTPKATTTAIASVYAVWSFLHLIMRILVVTIAASNVNLYAHKIEAILKKCPMECYSPQIEKTERAVRSSKVGLSGLGCFIITRPFILQIVNVVFTFEIVLLQTGNTNSTS